MVEYLPEILLWLFVINHGIAFGAGLYEHRIILPQWFIHSSKSNLRVNGEAIRSTDTGRRFWAFVTTVPLSLLTLANLFVAWRSPGPRHAWWLGAALITLVERTATFSYFIPTILRLMRTEAHAAASAEAMASRWMALNRIRLALALIGWLAALKTLSLPG